MTQSQRVAVNHALESVMSAKSLVDLARYQKEPQKLISMLLRVTNLDEIETRLQTLKGRV
ncbi:hypothetical protein ABGW26_09530 [Leuconostoc falkenbergense]|mgnify:CR=1 FL=1|uniref:hypothetical protein n=1 Tax=Leuconostoc TaxID=1243 RepID=UPI0002737EB6|nr:MULTISPECIES: hypothetical protein [Leuconostoc]OQJ68110.1 hypothetical protein BMS78_07375 [Leuconostoc pseudomesenteroides]CCJ65794.1 hypothetical protein Q5C_08395 [Leuconostoc pseudomesenteroides 4882]MCT4420438.1 hypothetical protein [Leuconostoc falkenbergense]OQJ68432.1 hypothetical protein BMS79_10130 [Leuconostoc pseudomesenteroides]OQJ79111.1 hypothetical protein BMS81_09500 [Leuconostoc pseudomesenteroides]